MLQDAIKTLPEDEARYHLKRCVDSGLWVPDASKADKEEESSAGADGDSDAAAASSSTDTTKPTVSTEDVD